MEFTKIWNYFKGVPTVHLATTDKDQPRVRPMSLIEYNDNLWFATQTSSQKLFELKENNKVEFSFGFIEEKQIGFIRVKGTIEKIEDMKIKEELVQAIPFFKLYWHDSQDPKYTLLKMDLTEVFYQPTDENGIKYVFDLTIENGRNIYTVVEPLRL